LFARAVVFLERREWCEDAALRARMMKTAMMELRVMEED